VLHPLGVGAVAWVVGELRAADRAEQALGHFLGGGRQANVGAVPAAVGIARAGVGRAAAAAQLDLSGQAVVGRLRPEHGEHGVEQRQIDHLAAPAVLLDFAQGDHRGGRAVEPGHGIREVHRRQHRLAVGETVERSESRHAFNQRAEAGAPLVRPVLAPAGNAHHDELRIQLVQ
jgi:hypothetical protein